jgi:hypothetical protein
MRRTILLWCFVAATAFWSPAFAETVGPAKIEPGQAAALGLELDELEVGSDGSVMGTIVNDGARVISNIELLVTHAWSWSDERHPGEDNPARAGVVRVTGEIPAKGSLAFSYTPNPPLPERTDGSFRTTAAVQSFTEVGD